MILYHFTKAENLKGIAERGLVPAIGKTTDSGALTLGIPVVWFTSNSQPLWMVGLGCGSDMCMLTVDINRKRLHHWRSWLANLQSDGIDENGKPRHFVGTEILDTMSRDKDSGAKRLTDTNNYWICTGIVHPMHIVECQPFEYNLMEDRPADTLSAEGVIR
jgi:hypothetical protein